jgi:threonyl-tRNA synthetase
LNEIAIKRDNTIIDLQTAQELGFEGEQIHLDNSEEALEVLRHSTAHLMAQAIKSLYPDAEFYVGPTIKDGFYYDFKTSQEIGESDLKKIEKQMLSFAKKKFPIEKYTITKEEAREKFANDHLKQAVLDMIPSDEVSIYKQGDFEIFVVDHTCQI